MTKQQARAASLRAASYDRFIAEEMHRRVAAYLAQRWEAAADEAAEAGLPFSMI